MPRSFLLTALMAGAFVCALLHGPFPVISKAWADPPMGAADTSPNPYVIAPNRQDEAGRQRLFERMEEIKFRRLNQALPLSPEQSQRLLEPLRRLDQDQWSLYHERSAVMKQLQGVMSDPNRPKGRAQELVNRIEQLDDRATKLHQDEYALIKGVLSPEEQASYLLFRQRFNQEVREKIREARLHRQEQMRDRGMERTQP
ncbi:MAG TPA: hypothetical protein VML36_03295 [Nitrospiria bacterium]|nr:hypothetical protein [Nitrospiria bacterium]